MNRTIGIVAAQVAPVPYDQQATWHAFERHVRTLAAVFPNLDLYVFPEVYLTALGSWNDGYPDGYVESVAEPIGGSLTQRISELARSVGKWIVPGSIYEAAGGDIYNTALAFDPEGELIATDGDEEIRALCPDCTVMMPTREPIIGREAVYLTQPVA